MQLTARKRWLEHITRVHRAFGLTGAYHGMNFVDKQNYPAFLLGEIGEHGLKPFFELAAELGASD
jgi:hypothetical protein